MKLNIYVKNIELDNPLRTFVEQKMSDIERLLAKEDALIKFEIGKLSKHHRTGLVFFAEANVSFGGKLLRAEAKHVDLRAAIVEVKDDLRVQIGKLKERAKAKRTGRLP